MAGNLSTLLINEQKERFRLQALKGEKNHGKKMLYIIDLYLNIFFL